MITTTLAINKTRITPMTAYSRPIAGDAASNGATLGIGGTATFCSGRAEVEKAGDIGVVAIVVLEIMNDSGVLDTSAEVVSPIEGVLGVVVGTATRQTYNQLIWN
jgi:hypothetical protein